MSLDKVSLQHPSIKEVCDDCGESSFKAVWNYLRKAEFDSKGRAEAYTLSKNGKVVGFIAFITSADHLRLIALAVKKSHHSKGYGTELLVALMRIARAYGKDRITFRTKIPRWWAGKGASATGKHENGEVEMEICL